MIPTTSADFDRAYRSPITFWGDVRVPKEVKALAALTRGGAGRRALELGCGLGRYTHYLAQQGLQATGVDFSPVAIARAIERDEAAGGRRAQFLVGDVTRLDMFAGPFDFAFDVGCFHCLDGAAQRGYVAEVSRLLPPGATHLIWALDGAPSGATLSPELVRACFAGAFELKRAETSRRRLARSHWYWLVRSSNESTRSRAAADVSTPIS